MKHKKILAIFLTVILVTGATVGVGAAVRLTTGNAPATVVPLSEILSGGIDGEKYAEGEVSKDGSQFVYLSETEKIEEIKVKVGDRVKAGDVLLVYDTKKTNLNFESEKLNLQKLKLQEQIALQNIKLLSQKRPMAMDPGLIPDEPEDPGTNIPEDPNAKPKEPTDDPNENPGENPGEKPEQPAYNEIIVHEILNEHSRPFYNTSEEAGTEANPYRFLVKDNTKLTAKFIALLKQLKPAKDGSCFVEIEIRAGDVITGRLRRAWMQDMAGLKPIDLPNTWESNLAADDESGFIISNKAKKSNPGNEGNPGAGEDSGNTDPSDQGGTSGSGEGSESGENTGNVSEGSKEQENSDAHREGENTDRAERGTDRSKKAAQGSPVANLTSRIVQAEDGEADTGDVQAGGELISPSRQFTAEELKAEKAKQNQKLEDVRLDIREQELKLKKAERALQSGKVYAFSDGIVKKVGDPERLPKDGSAFIEVAGLKGMTIKSAVNERFLGNVNPGDEIGIQDWNTRNRYRAVIDDISTYPETNGRFGNPDYAVSYYPFTAHFIDADVDIEDGTSVQVLFNPSQGGMTMDEEMPAEDMSEITDEAAPEDEETAPEDEASSSEVVEDFMSEDGVIQVMRAFVRTDGGAPYMMIRDERGRLKKQSIELVSQNSDSCGIKGISSDAFVAFPYGKGAKEGARTKEGSISELYDA